MLCYNGVETAQSMAVARFLANEFGLSGKNNLEKARADMIVDCVSDIFAGMVAIFKAPEDKKAEMKKKYETETIPAGLELLEKLLKQNGSKFFVGNCVSVVSFIYIFTNFHCSLTNQIGFTKKTTTNKQKIPSIFVSNYELPSLFR